MPNIKSIVIATVIFLCMDYIWLGYLGRDLYMSSIGELMKSDSNESKIHYIPAVLAYATLIMGLMVFVIPKAAGSATAALGWGALFGFVCYGVYDFTNLAVITKWPVMISIIDIAWGCVVCGVTSCLTVLISRQL